MIRRFLAMLAFVFALAALPTPAAAIPSNCTGKFVNPITDICWSCLFPLSVGGLPIWPGSRPDTKNPALPVCACGSPVPRIGIAIGFWEPARMVDVTGKSPTVRTATATGRVVTSSEVLTLLRSGGVPKGDVLAVARIAGIQAAKRTPAPRTTME